MRVKHVLSLEDLSKEEILQLVRRAIQMKKWRAAGHRPIIFDGLVLALIFDNKRDFKDFISIDKFCEIIKNIIKKNLIGTYNVSIGKKIYLNDLLNWLNKFNKKKYLKKIKKINDDSFFLNNKKLMSKLKIKNSVSELKSYCFKISKKKIFLTFKY